MASRKLLILLGMVALALANELATTGPVSSDGECVTTATEYPGDEDFTVHAVYDPNVCGSTDKVCLKFPGGPPGPGGGAGTCPDWTYYVDSNNDGSGGCNYELGGVAFRHTQDYSYFVITSGHPLNGSTFGSNTQIDYGDLLLSFGDNIKGSTWASVDGTADAWGIHFSPDGDGSQEAPGVYSHIKSQSVANLNSGFSSYQSYLNWAGSKDKLGQNYADSSDDVNVNYYTGNQKTPTSIDISFTGQDKTKRQCGFEYLIFPEDAEVGSEDCSGGSTSRYCLNNPRAQHYHTGASQDTENICDSHDDAVNDIGCVDVDSIDGFNFDTSEDKYGKRAGCNVYRQGFRIDNSCWGSRGAVTAASEPDFRACFTVECGNDVACLDGEFTCPQGNPTPPPVPGPGPPAPCVDIFANNANGDLSLLTQNSVYQVLDHGYGQLGAYYGMRFDNLTGDGASYTFSFEQQNSAVFFRVSGDDAAGTAEIRFFGYMYGGKGAGLNNWVNPSQWFFDITGRGCGLASGGGWECVGNDAGSGFLVDIGGSSYTELTWKKKGTQYVKITSPDGGDKNQPFIGLTGWLMRDVPLSGAQDIIGKVGPCIDEVSNTFPATATTSLCDQLNRDEGSNAYECGACKSGSAQVAGGKCA